jgi:hypothetical protein
LAQHTEATIHSINKFTTSSSKHIVYNTYDISQEFTMVPPGYDLRIFAAADLLIIGPDDNETIFGEVDW